MADNGSSKTNGRSVVLNNYIKVVWGSVTAFVLFFFAADRYTEHKIVTLAPYAQEKRLVDQRFSDIDRRVSAVESSAAGIHSQIALVNQSLGEIKGKLDVFMDQK